MNMKMNIFMGICEGINNINPNKTLILQLRSSFAPKCVFQNFVSDLQI